MTEKLDLLGVNRQWRFERRPVPVPGTSRPVWLIILTLLALHLARGRKLTLQKLHVITWAAKDKLTQDATLKVLLGKEPADSVVPRIEPGLNRALDFAFAEQLIELNGKTSIKLTPKGLKAVKEVDNDLECMAQEKAFLLTLQPYMYGKALQELAEGPRIK